MSRFVLLRIVVLMFSCLGLYREYVADLSMLKRKALHEDQEMPAVSKLTLDEVLTTIRTKTAVIILSGRTKSAAAAINQAKQVLDGHSGTLEIIDTHNAGTGRDAIEQALVDLTGRGDLSTRGSQFPLIFIKGDCVGNVDDLSTLDANGVLKEWLKSHDFDLIVIGGGSGGLAAAQAAADDAKKVACLDYVVPTPQGTTWGLGGTCVNVGCIPKKLMHQAALIGHFIKDAKKFGWQYDEKSLSHNWNAMKDAVQGHIASLNWGNRVALRQKNIKYLNSYGKFIGTHTISAKDKNGAEEQLSADRFLIATGLRPRYLDVPGAKEYCITSDDLFKLPYPPGKTLVVGASYVALECAGFLHGTGFDVTVMVRSILLRGFDQDMAERIGKHMEDTGIKFIKKTIPTKIELIEDGQPRRLRVTAKSETGEEIVDEYNTVMLGIGRDAVTDNLGFDVAKIKRNEKNKKLICHKNEQSVSAPYVYAVGDVLDGGIELTPVAIQAGRLLMRRLFSNDTTLCDYTNIPTTVFTPLEYGCCGYAEENAIAKFGEDSVEVFHVQFEPLEFTVPHRADKDHCYIKLICNKQDDLRVLGFHILGPNAGEVTQGFGIALKLNAKKADFDRLIGIHPTVAENFTTLKVTKASNLDSKAGKC